MSRVTTSLNATTATTDVVEKDHETIGGMICTSDEGVDLTKRVKAFQNDFH